MGCSDSASCPSWDVIHTPTLHPHPPVELSTVKVELPQVQHQLSIYILNVCMVAGNTVSLEMYGFSTPVMSCLYLVQNVTLTQWCMWQIDQINGLVAMILHLSVILPHIWCNASAPMSSNAQWILHTWCMVSANCIDTWLDCSCVAWCCPSVLMLAWLLYASMWCGLGLD